MACTKHISRRNRGNGFTLVELLVVITIIAMLMGLLIPAVQSARRSGQRATCMNNQQQLGKAFFNYATTKDKFPPGFYAQPLAPTIMVGWVPTMLPYIEQNPLYLIFQTNTWANVKDATVSTLVCPSRNGTVSPAPLTYVVNAGRTDNNMPAASTPMDWQENGVFFDLFTNVGTPAKVTTDLGYISKHDGTSTTLMLSENIDARDWITLTTTPTASLPYQTTQTISNLNLTWWQGIVWSVPSPAPPTYPNTNVLNKGAGIISTIDDSNARPSSYHPGGFIVTMCDAHSQFISEDIEYRVYCLLMAPESGNSKLAGANTIVTYPTDWYITGTTLKPVTDADILK